MADIIPITNLRGPAARIVAMTTEVLPPGVEPEAEMIGPDQGRVIHMKLAQPDSVAQTGIIENGDLIVTFESGKVANAGRARGADGLSGTDGVPTDEAIGTAIGTAGTSASKTAVREVAGIIDGLVADDVTDNRARIQACLDKGGSWVLPATPGRYLVNGALEVSVPGTSLNAAGAPIRQGVGGQALFNITVPDVTIDGVDAIGDLDSLDITGMNAAWEMSIIASRWTVINAYTGAHRLAIPWIRGRGFDSVVRVTSWDRTAGAIGNRVKDVSIGTLLCENVEFGLVAHGTERLSYQEIKGSYCCPVAGPRPPHLVYFSGSNGENIDASCGSAIASGFEGGVVPGQAFQFKGMRGGRVTSLLTQGCPGVLNVMDSTDFAIDFVSSLGDTCVDPYGSIALSQTTTLSNVRIARAVVRMVSDGIPFRLTSGSDCRFGEFDFEVKHTTAGTLHDVSLAGVRNSIESVRVQNIGAKAWRGLALWSGAGHRVGRVVLEAMRIGVEVRGTATGANIAYDPATVTLHPTDGLAKIMVAPGAAPTLVLPGTPPAASRVRVLDDFTIAPETLSGLGPGWITQLGTWAVDYASGEAGETAGTAQSNAYRDAGVANVSLEVDVKLRGLPGVIARRVSATEYLAIYLSTTAVTIAKRDGTLTTLATQAGTYQQDRWYRLRVDVFGAVVSVTVNDLPVLSHTLAGGDETKFGTSTVHGLFSSASAGASKFKRFQVSRI
ncbi:hypothetical protein [Microbacterium sp. NPDC055599]